MKTSPESIGQRIARLRQQHSYTQQTLADRLAISRVAISHIEANLSIPSERTIILLAGLFKCTPHELVKGTSYPPAKAERLPSVVAWFTAFELDIELLKNDMKWGQNLKDKKMILNMVQEWEIRLTRWEGEYLDVQEQKVLAYTRKKLREMFL